MVAIGDRLPPFVIDSVDVGRMKTLAVLLRDSNPIHWNGDLVRRLGMGPGPINQGPTSIAYVMNMLIAWAGDAAALRRFKVRCLANAYAGDRVEAGGEVVGVMESAEGCLAECHVWLDRGDGTRLLDGSAVVWVS